MDYNRACLLILLLIFYPTLGDAAAKGFELTEHQAKWIPLNIPNSFPRLGWTLMNIGGSLTTDYRPPNLGCRGEGFHNHPFDCTKFYRCINEYGSNGYTALTFSCATGTVFSQELGSCVKGYCSDGGVSKPGQPTVGASASAELPTNPKGVPDTNLPSRSNVVPVCHREGRIADPEDCGQFYDCVMDVNGKFLANKQSCGGQAFDATLEHCVPLHKAKGCLPYPNNGLRNVNVNDPKLQTMCIEHENGFFCLDCKTLVMCIGRLPQIIECGYGDTCYSDTDVFRGGVCHPAAPVECTCNSTDIFKPDIYDPSKYIACNSQGAEPLIQNCPEGLEFNEYKSCGAPTDTTCSKAGTFAVQSDCNKYQTCTYTTTGSFFQSVFTCEGNTMYNQDLGRCEDPCDWYNGTFVCEEEGRFPNPGDCSAFYECIKEPSDNEKFIQTEQVCQEGYEWLPLANEYHCVPKGITKEKCVPKKPNTCNVPREWCTAVTDLQTKITSTTEPQTASAATTTTTTTTTASTTTTTTQSPIETCPEGFFRGPGSSKCYKALLQGSDSWAGYKKKCESEGLTLAEPDNEKELQLYLNENYGGYWYWVGIQGTGNFYAGINTGQILSDNSSLWLGGQPDEPIRSSSYCVSMTTHSIHIENRPNQVYADGGCVNKLSAALCEAPPTSVITSFVRNVCPDGHFQVGPQCFFIPKEGFKTWRDAQALCTAKGSFLAEPDSITEFLQVLETQTSGYGFWLGGSKRKQDGDWWWSSQGVKVGNSGSWNQKEHNSINTSDQCLFLMRGLEKPLTARSCIEEHHYFICERR